jgi:hypothetical protein
LLRTYFFFRLFFQFMLRNTFTLFLSVLLFTSCVSQTKVLQMMHSGEILKPATPNLGISGNNLNTRVTYADVKGIRQWPQVKQQKFSCIPLLVFTNWNSTYNCNIGLRDVEQNLEGNLNTALQWHFNNSPAFRNSASTDTASAYTLEVSVDTLQSNIPFVSKGTFIFIGVAYSYWFREGVDAASMSVTTRYTLKQRGNILKQGTVETSRLVAKWPNNTGSKKKYMKRYLGNYFIDMNTLLSEHAGRIINQLESNI